MMARLLKLSQENTVRAADSSRYRLAADGKRAGYRLPRCFLPTTEGWINWEPARNGDAPELSVNEEIRCKSIRLWV